MAERAAFLQRLDPDHVDDYREAHEAVPSVVTDTMAAGEVEWFDVYVRDEVAVCVLSVADRERFAAVYEREMAANEALAEWEELNDGFKQSGIADGDIPWMDRIWTNEFD
jgi:L-rhamnose mutarotase